VRTTKLRFIAFFAVISLQGALLAQTDPLNPSAAPTQPNQPGRVHSPSPSLQDSAGAPNNTVEEMKDKMFLRRATEGGLAQVQLGQLAVTNGGSPEVKELGQKLAEEHTKLNASMAVVADSIGMRLPKNLNKGDQAKYDKLKALSGEAFDKEYLACMVRDHHEDLRDFRVESQTTTDPDLRAMVEHGAKVLREHLSMVAKLAVQNGVPIPRHGSKPEQAAASPPQ
jgi:putative membrane protein